MQNKIKLNSRINNSKIKVIVGYFTVIQIVLPTTLTFIYNVQHKHLGKSTVDGLWTSINNMLNVKQTI